MRFGPGKTKAFAKPVWLSILKYSIFNGAFADPELV
jgi:hypothetical protein